MSEKNIAQRQVSTGYGQSSNGDLKRTPSKASFGAASDIENYKPNLPMIKEKHSLHKKSKSSCLILDSKTSAAKINNSKSKMVPNMYSHLFQSSPSSSTAQQKKTSVLQAKKAVAQAQFISQLKMPTRVDQKKQPEQQFKQVQKQNHAQVSSSEDSN